MAVQYRRQHARPTARGGAVLPTRSVPLGRAAQSTAARHTVCVPVDWGGGWHAPLVPACESVVSARWPPSGPAQSAPRPPGTLSARRASRPQGWRACLGSGRGGRRVRQGSHKEGPVTWRPAGAPTAGPPGAMWPIPAAKAAQWLTSRLGDAPALLPACCLSVCTPPALVRPVNRGVDGPAAAHSPPLVTSLRAMSQVARTRAR